MKNAPSTLFAKFVSNNPLTFCQNNDDIANSRHWLLAFNDFLHQQLQMHPLDRQLQMIDDILVNRTLGVDYLIGQYANVYFVDNYALLALGGYGRYELSPKSDIDLLVIYQNKTQERLFLDFNAFLWDIGLKPAFNYYCIDNNYRPTDLSPMDDISHATAILDRRFIVGHHSFLALPSDWLLDRWQYDTFYQAKIDEKNIRQAQHQYTVQHLEPNLKTGVGSLRAIQLLVWLLTAKETFYSKKSAHNNNAHPNNHAQTKSFLVLSNDFLSNDESLILKNALRFFWLIRHYLHQFSKKGEERLLFSYQKSIGDILFFAKNPNNPNDNAEQLMHQYFKNAMGVHCVVENLYELLDNTPHQETLIQSIDPFIIIQKNGKKQLKTSNEKVFFDNPKNLLKLFLVMAENHIKKIDANTLRQLQQYAYLIDDDYSKDSENQAIFLKLFYCKPQLANLFNLMAKYGILGRYLPDFGAIMGLMQYDMFHRYTVDNHTLRLLAIFGQFGGFDAWLPSDLLDDTLKQNRHFWQLHKIYEQLAKPHLLHIAALFHDIAKGQEGDHAINGAVIADAFCRQHGFDDDDTTLVAWLVREHLTMSHTAQKQDINDPTVLLNFAKLVGDDERLDYLYLLTIADMNATNHQLWNDWRATLLHQLYLSTRPLLTQKFSPDAILTSRKDKALTMIDNKSGALALWADFDDDYFAKDNADTLAWHANLIISHQNRPLIGYRPHPDTGLNAYELMIFCQSQAGLFFKIVTALDGLNYGILKASITTNRQNYALDNFVIVSRTAPTLTDDDSQTLGKLQTTLLNALQNNPPTPTPAPNHAFLPIYQHTPKSPNFHIRPSIQITPNQDGTHTLGIVTKDRPRLLADIASVLFQEHILLHSANVMTLGVRAEDSFVLSGGDTPLDDHKLTTLKKALQSVVNAD